MFCFSHPRLRTKVGFLGKRTSRITLGWESYSRKQSLHTTHLQCTIKQNGREVSTNQDLREDGCKAKTIRIAEEVPTNDGFLDEQPKQHEGEAAANHGIQGHRCDATVNEWHERCQ